ncbi:uncharacterized protein [Mytilus edulis]|uniref:uncharacterized protein n=1 Tax=Mytilus edulis TaxID=6550 RepID=UPI0039F00C94
MGDRDSRHEKHDRDNQGWRQERSVSPVVTPIQTKDMQRRGWRLDTLERRLAHYTPLPPIKPKKVTPKVHKGIFEHLLSMKPEKITPETHEGRLEQYTPFPSILPKHEIHNRDNQERRKENSSYPITILSRTTDVPSSTGYGSIFSDRGISTVNTNIEDNKQDVTYFPATPPYEEKQTKRPLELHGYSFGRENFEQASYLSIFKPARHI